MSRSLQPYADYRSGELSAVATIPSHWRSMRIKHLANLRSGQSITSEAIDPEGAFPVYGGNGLRGYTSSFTHDGPYILIGRQGALCGNINYAERKFWASEHAVVATPVQQFDRFWFGELLRHMDLNQYSISAAQPGLAVERIRNLEIPVPPLQEQAAISRYLQHKTRAMTALIRNKRRLIALLNEEKQAVIQQAVTQGLDPDVPMKPSGVEWLGEVPAHWSVAEAKTQFEIRLGKMHQGTQAIPTDMFVPYIKSQHVQWFAVKTDALPHMWASPSDLATVEVSEGDFLVCEGGEAGRCGIVVKVPSPCIIEKSIHRVRGRKGANVEYLQYVLYTVSTTGWFSATNNKSTIAHFTREKFGWLLIPVPPPDEQHA